MGADDVALSVAFGATSPKVRGFWVVWFKLTPFCIVHSANDGFFFSDTNKLYSLFLIFSFHLLIIECFFVFFKTLKLNDRYSPYICDSYYITKINFRVAKFLPTFLASNPTRASIYSEKNFEIFISCFLGETRVVGDADPYGGGGR